MGDFDTTAISGVEAGGYRRGGASTDRWDQYVVPVRDRIVSFRGRANSFRTLGIAGTTGHKLMTLFNASGSTTTIEIQKIYVDVMFTAAKVIQPPITRIHKLTALPTGGTAMTKIPLNSGAPTSTSNLTILQSTASDGGTATAITATPAANTIISQIWQPRALTLVGYEPVDRIELCEDEPFTLNALEGVLLNLDYTAAGASAVTDMYIHGVVWEEYTRP